MISFKKRSWKANKRDKAIVDLTLHLFLCLPSACQRVCVGEK